MPDVTSEPPSGLLNLRDVGGVPAGGGRRVRSGRLYRSEAPILGDPEPPLRPWPPRTVVDLRSDGEATTGTHPLASPDTQIVNIPLFRRLDPARMAATGSPDPPDLPTIYRRLMRTSAANLIAVMRVIAHGPSPTLLHCAAGKDRTGVATAVALAAVGVAPEAIVADYRRTEPSREALLSRLALGWSEDHREANLRQLTVERPDLMLAPAAAIEAVLETLEAWPEQTRGWLLDHGLTDHELERLVERLTAL